MKPFLTLIFLLIPFYAVQALGAQLIPKMGSLDVIDSSLVIQNISDYQIGDEWGKQIVTDDILNSSEILNRVAMATGQIGGGTGFVLGEFNGEILVATNHHVCSSGLYYKCHDIEFPLMKIKAKVKKFLGTWKEVDLTLVTLNVSQNDRLRLLQVAKNFEFDNILKKGAPLVTAGFGFAGNPNGELVINFDFDCRVLSDDDDFVLMADPDEFNKLPYEAWSFANGCDVSHGDSGSSIVDAATGSPVGIIWTGKIPKGVEAQSSALIGQWELDQSPEIWTELSYAVPAKKIKQVLNQKLQEGEMSQSIALTIEALLKD